jgi:hypothetical protein
MTINTSNNVLVSGSTTKRPTNRKIQPLLRGLSNSVLALALDVSVAYAADNRAGRRRPHPRHWQALAQLVGISADG